MIDIPRRGFITSIIALAAAPAIVRASSLMPVKPLLLPRDITSDLDELRRNGGNPDYSHLEEYTFIGFDQFGVEIRETVRALPGNPNVSP